MSHTETATTPDLVLSNNKTHHNIDIKPGPLTTSDHIPIIVLITANTITEPTPNSINTLKADWKEGFQNRNTK